MKNIILFGASLSGEKVIKDYQSFDDIKILAVSDNDKKKHGNYILGKKIISPSEIELYNYDQIVISSVYDDEIFEQLVNLGIKKEKIIRAIVNPKNMHLDSLEKSGMAEELMFYISELFNLAEIDYYIDHGTLLGIKRDNKILPWDVDIDFASFYTQKDKIINVLSKYLESYSSSYCEENNWKFELLTERDYSLTLEEKEEDIAIKIYNDVDDSLSNNFGVDIYLKYIKGNEVTWLIGRKRLYMNIDNVNPLSKIIFKDKILKVPSNTDRYLESLYGDWNKIVKEWSFDKYVNIRKD